MLPLVVMEAEQGERRRVLALEVMEDEGQAEQGERRSVLPLVVMVAEQEERRRVLPLEVMVHEGQAEQKRRAVPAQTCLERMDAKDEQERREIAWDLEVLVAEVARAEREKIVLAQWKDRLPLSPPLSLCAALQLDSSSYRRET